MKWAICLAIFGLISSAALAEKEVQNFTHFIGVHKITLKFFLPLVYSQDPQIIPMDDGKNYRAFSKKVTF